MTTLKYWSHSILTPLRMDEIPTIFWNFGGSQPLVGGEKWNDPSVASFVLLFFVSNFSLVGSGTW